MRLSSSSALIATLLLAVALTVAAAAESASGNPQQAAGGGRYVALGDSVAAGYGASSRAKSYVGLLLSHYQSTLGVTTLSNRAQSGATSASIRTGGGQLDRALADIDAASDTRALTIDIGANDRNVCLNNWDSCPFRANLAATLSDLKTALDGDPGQERFAAMAYYNPASGRGGFIEHAYDANLLGGDRKIDCAVATGSDVGLNDVIFQEAGRYGAGVANAYPAFKTGGQSLIAADDYHPNDAGHAAVADAFRHPSFKCAPAPQTTITKVPVAKTIDRTPRFRFRSDQAAATFKCSIDDGKHKRCSSPYTLKRLALGRHVFKVKAALNGVADPTPAKYRFKVIRRS